MADRGDAIGCVEPGCDEQIKDHRWGKTKASGWFFSRDNTQAFCPEHVPDWVAGWRARKSASKGQ